MHFLKIWMHLIKKKNNIVLLKWRGHSSHIRQHTVLPDDMGQRGCASVVQGEWQINCTILQRLTKILSYCFQEIWLTEGLKDGRTVYFPATGYIEERLRNLRKRLRPGSSPGSSRQMPEASQPHKTYIPGNCERSEQLTMPVRPKCQSVCLSVMLHSRELSMVYR